MSTYEEIVRAEVREVNSIPWGFGISMVTEGWENDAIQGLHAIARLWFHTYEDETKLPRQLLDMVDLLDDLYVDTSEFEDDDEDEDEDFDCIDRGRDGQADI